MSDEPWYVWLVTYGTYADPDTPPRLISGPLPFNVAALHVERLGFGHCMKDHP